jgi:radical SAM superfamily enzyme YgiQ (UPF0313 family)
VPPLNQPGAILLISCYELGRQPLALASASATLRGAGFAPAALDLALEPLDPESVRRARCVAISVPMHAALRLGARAAARIRELNPEACIVFFGLYASLNADYLLSQRGATAVIGGEFELPLLRLVEALERGDRTDLPGVRTASHAAAPFLEKIPFAVPDRTLLPPLTRYVRLEADGGTRVAGHVEASRGCLHLCRHCPIPPVYGGRFFIVPREVVLADIAGQVGAGAMHITFGDPDFLNGPGHTMALARDLHARWPSLTFDVTAKVEHILRHAALLPELRSLGCLFIVSAVESNSARVLEILHKGHGPDAFDAVLELTRAAGITLRPTFVPFTPWTTLQDHRALLELIVSREMEDQVDPVQMSIRLLAPPGSLLAEHPEFLPHRKALDQDRFTWLWTHPDRRMDRLQQEATVIAERAAESAEDPAITFARLAAAADAIAGATAPAGSHPPMARRDKGRAPRLTEPWFC